jgi:hypothetical protein
MRFLVFTLAAVCLVGCGPPSADEKTHASQEALTQESNAQVGMPGITRFTEKRLVRQLYEMRDASVATYSYMPDMQGKLWHLCDSVGFGLPYGVQFTNPEYRTYDGGGFNLPQPEPNGLFMPPTAEGTWVFCLDEKGKPAPLYVEPRVIVSTHKLRSSGEYWEPAEGK